MQDNSKIFYKSVGKVIKKIKKQKNIRYTELCYENDIPTSTYDDIVNAKTQAKFYNVAKIIKGLDVSFEYFGKLLDEELPKDYMLNE